MKDKMKLIYSDFLTHQFIFVENPVKWLFTNVFNIKIHSSNDV